MYIEEQQIKNFIMPAKILCLGAGTELQGFADQATKECQVPVDILDIKRVALRNNIQVHKKIKLNAQHSASLIIPLSAARYSDINFLSHEQHKIHNRLLNMQICTALLLSVATVLGLYFYSNYQLQQWDKEYDKSRKQMVNLLKEQMDIDVKNVKRISEIVAAAQSKLQQTKKVCYSYSPSNNTFLKHLQELCSVIDSKSIGLDLKKMSLNDKEVILQGKINGSELEDKWEALTTFEKELMELPSFTLKNIPGELAFTVTLLVKEDHDKNKD